MLRIDPLRPADLQAAMRLSIAAGWNQPPADWQRLLDLWPGNCLGGWGDGQLVATATLAVYGSQVGWIGMILVDPAHRGAGLGTAMFCAAMDRARELAIPLLGLDATDMGRPLYEKHGFVVHGEIDRWVGTPVAASQHNHGQIPPDFAAILELDKEATGTDRGPLLRHLGSADGCSCHVLMDDGMARGFSFIRPGWHSWTIGPIVARDASTAEALLTLSLAHIRADDAQAQVCIDIPETSLLRPILPRYGLTVQRHLWRMARPSHGTGLLDGPMVAAAAGFELG